MDFTVYYKINFFLIIERGQVFGLISHNLTFDDNKRKIFTIKNICNHDHGIICVSTLPRLDDQNI